MAATACVIFALAIDAAPAIAGTRHYNGSFLTAGSVSFTGVGKHGRVGKVLQFGWNNVPITCDQGNYHLTQASFTFAMKVLKSHNPTKNRTFSGIGEINGNAFQVFVVGHFNRSFTHAQGNFEAKGDYSSQATNCDTGEVHWTAHLG